jgi:hypothetical protein
VPIRKAGGKRIFRSVTRYGPDFAGLHDAIPDLNPLLAGDTKGSGWKAAATRPAWKRSPSASLEAMPEAFFLWNEFT